MNMHVNEINISTAKDAGLLLLFWETLDFEEQEFNDFLNFFKERAKGYELNPVQDTQEALNFLFRIGAIQEVRYSDQPNKLYYAYNLRG